MKVLSNNKYRLSCEHTAIASQQCVSLTPYQLENTFFIDDTQKRMDNTLESTDPVTLRMS